MDPKETSEFFLNLFKNETDVVLKRAGELIVEIGKPGDVVYVLTSGTAQVNLFEGKHPVEIHPGDLIGLMGSIKGRNYEDTTVALTDCELVPIDRRKSLFLLHEHPTFAFQLMRVLTDRFYFVMDKVKEIYGNDSK
jgi:CRP-like cAMP-binding protein